MNEKITKYKVFAVIIVLLGIIFLVNPFPLSNVENLYGIIVGLLDGISLSAWVIFGRVAGKKKIHPITTKFSYILFMMIFLAISYPIVNFLVKETSIISFSVNQ